MLSGYLGAGQGRHESEVSIGIQIRREIQLPVKVVEIGTAPYSGPRSETERTAFPGWNICLLGWEGDDLWLSDMSHYTVDILDIAEFIYVIVNAILTILESEM